ncbi:MAG TPA: branched-chain amino acid ABC transporter permease [Thermodesulfobacteriota bacterium]|nr:branched-chain amino acid ABC transporter permease [Thermodesulfobacteriota bacterium]
MEGYEELFGPRRFYRRLLGLGIFSAIVLLAPLVVEDPYYLELLFLCHYYVILACSWDLLSGFTGNINFGHAFFIAGAGYTGALLNLNLGWQYWLTLPAGGIIAALFGLLVGVVTLRLKGPYFAAVTFCFGALLYKWFMVSSKSLGGEEGLSGVASLSDSPLGNYYFSGIFMIAVVLGLYFLSKSSFGLILRSIGENETASEGSGINTIYFKVVAFMISAAIAGVAGAMYAHAQMHVGPEMAHDSLSALVLMMAVVGGMGSIIGPIMGAYLLTMVNESLRFMGELRLLIYSGAVVAVILFAPKGLLEILSQGFRRVTGDRQKAV